MREEVESGGAATQAPELLELRPIKGKHTPPWHLKLDDGLLTLLEPEGRIVMMVPREEAVLHLRFDWDLFHGKVASFVVVPGLKAFKFKCGRHTLNTLLDWLPSKSAGQLHQEVRYYGAAMVVLGMIQLLFPEHFQNVWGVAFIVQGLLTMLMPRRFWFLFHAAWMMAGGLAVLMHGTTLLPEHTLFEELVDPLLKGFGALLVAWSVQQLSLLSPNQRLRSARRVYNEEQSENGYPSPTIRKVAWGAAFVAGLFLLQLAGAAVKEFWSGTPAGVPTWTLCITFAAVTVLAAVVLQLRQVNYLEAKVIGQMCIVLAIMRAAGQAMTPLDGSRLPFDPELLWNGLFALGAWYTWIPIVFFVLLFNWWFGRAVDREMSAAEDEGE